MPILQFSRPASKHMSLMTLMLIGGAALGPLLGPTVSLADDTAPIVNEKFADLAPGIKLLRAEVGQNRRDVVAASMLLTKSEGDIFWPLYDQYRAEQHELGDRRVRLITDFIANRDTMSEEQAATLTRDALAIEKKKTSIKEDYVSKMSKVLTARTVARFFQIDNKLDTVVDVQLAARIPLIH
jgi:hypothetical protein